MKFAKRNSRKKKPQKPIQPESMPKYPQSCFFLYLNERRAGMRQKYPGKRMYELSILIAEEWNNKPPEAKKVYEDQAAKDKVQYNKDMEEYEKTEEYNNYQMELDDFNKAKERWENSMDVDNDDDMPKPQLPQKPRDPHSPKQPTAYNLFKKAIREEIKTAHPRSAPSKIEKEISKKWRSLSGDEKKQYEDEAKRLKEPYKIAMQEYIGTENHQRYQVKLELWEHECNRRMKKAREDYVALKEKSYNKDKEEKDEDTEASDINKKKRSKSQRDTQRAASETQSKKRLKVSAMHKVDILE